MFDYSDFRNKLRENWSRKFFPDFSTVNILSRSGSRFFGGLKLEKFPLALLKKKNTKLQIKD
jgi:hypothetical protein